MKNKPQPDAPQLAASTAAAADVTTTAVAPPPEVPAAEAAPAVATSATGLPIDKYHGHAGTYILRNGVRELAK